MTTTAVTGRHRLAGVTRWWRNRGLRIEHGLILSDRLWTGWTRTYEAADFAAIEQPQLRCPGCRHTGLRLVYTANDLAGFASMWCPACQTGIRTSRPPAGGSHSTGAMPADQLKETIDDFRPVHRRHDERWLRRWSRIAATACGLGLGAILAAAAAAAVLNRPAVGELLLQEALPAAFTLFGLASAISLHDRYRDHRRSDHASPPRRVRWAHTADLVDDPDPPRRTRPPPTRAGRSGTGRLRAPTAGRHRDRADGGSCLSQARLDSSRS